jgi:hypothetical protein
MNAIDKEFPAMSPHETDVPLRRIQGMIFTMRGLPVMIDRDLADMYGVENKRLNEQVKRNIERFPTTFRFQLTDAERDELVANCDRFASLKHATTNPYAFTEQGVSMEKRLIAFESKTAETSTQLGESARLEQEIRGNLKELGYEW